jgi:hypothetical protein
MANLKRASRQLFSRPDDERFEDLDALHNHCRQMQRTSNVHWQMPNTVQAAAMEGGLGVQIGNDGAFLMNDWSFGQICSLAEVHKETVNRLAPDTAARVLRETLPSGHKPLQVFTQGNSLRAIHGTSYTRLFDADLIEVVRNVADGFHGPPKGFNGATGLYAGQQDMFAFLIDDSGWVDIGGEQFAPGFFFWNSEVGRRTVGVETFWYQRICANHIVWDAIEVVSYSRKHTANVDDAVQEIRAIIGRLVDKRNLRRDAFAKKMQTAMETSLGHDAEEATKALTGRGIPMNYVKDAVQAMAAQGGKYTLFQAVDALTRMTGRLTNAGDRTEQDARIGNLLTLAV